MTGPKKAGRSLLSSRSGLPIFRHVRDTTSRFALLRGGAPGLTMMLWVGLMDYLNGSRGPLSANNWHSTAPVSAVAGAVPWTRLDLDEACG